MTASSRKAGESGGPCARGVEVRVLTCELRGHQGGQRIQQRRHRLAQLQRVEVCRGGEGQGRGGAVLRWAILRGPEWGESALASPEATEHWRALEKRRQDTEATIENRGHQMERSRWKSGWKAMNRRVRTRLQQRVDLPDLGGHKPQQPLLLNVCHQLGAGQRCAAIAAVLRHSNNATALLPPASQAGQPQGNVSLCFHQPQGYGSAFIQPQWYGSAATSFTSWARDISALARRYPAGQDRTGQDSTAQHSTAGQYRKYGHQNH